MLKMALFLPGLLLVLVLIALKSYFPRTKNPPGPAKLPVVGNIFNMPRYYAWETYRKWGEIYGSVCSMLLCIG